MKLQLTGWILFVISATFFIASSIKAGDPLSLIGGLFFFVSCFLFIYSLIKSGKPRGNRDNDGE